MIRHWFYLDNFGNIKEGDADNFYVDNPREWWFDGNDDCNDWSSIGLINEDHLYETREQAREASIQYHKDRIQEHEAKLYALMNEVLNEG